VRAPGGARALAPKPNRARRAPRRECSGFLCAAFSRVYLASRDLQRRRPLRSSRHVAPCHLLCGSAVKLHRSCAPRRIGQGVRTVSPQRPAAQRPGSADCHEFARRLEPRPPHLSRRCPNSQGQSRRVPACHSPRDGHSSDLRRTSGDSTRTSSSLAESVSTWW
jgi:hypothetical protein